MTAHVKRSSRESLIRHIEALGVAPGDDVVVHSRLISFGVIEGDAPAVVLDALRSVVGSSATIAAPTYVFADQPDAIYEAATTPSTAAGVFSEHVRTRDGAVRSASPVHSHAAIGPKAELLTRSPETASFGPGSDFEILKDAGFKLVLLGCLFSQGATYLHHLEAVANAPYREWVVSKKRVRDADGGVRTVDLRYFARRDAAWAEDFDKVVPGLIEDGVVIAAPAHYGRSFAAHLPRLDAAGRDLLEADPFAFVSPTGDAPGAPAQA
ncbi:MAG: AAC(3) family N-acetyltransferase [Pseudomonadota bacterium]